MITQEEVIYTLALLLQYMKGIGWLWVAIQAMLVVMVFEALLRIIIRMDE